MCDAIFIRILLHVRIFLDVFLAAALIQGLDAYIPARWHISSMLIVADRRPRLRLTAISGVVPLS